MKVYSSEQIRHIEASTVDKEQICWDKLMENAAKAFISQLDIDRLNYFSECIILCGSGNNGGDGVVIGQILASILPYPIKLLLFDNFSQKSELRQSKLKPLLINNKIHLYSIDDQCIIPIIKPNTLIIDALFGIGLNKPIRSPLDKIIDKINQSGAEVISVDVPSGLYADTQNQSNDKVIKASRTITFQYPKLTFLLSENIENVGKLSVADIGLIVPNKMITYHYLNTKEVIASKIKKRPRTSHKGQNGRVLIVGGAEGMSGAPVLAALASLNSGAGYTFLYSPKHTWPAAQQIPDIMVRSNDNDSYLEKITIEEKDTVAIGPGLGKRKKTADALIKVLDGLQKPVVLDADALNILSSKNAFGLIPKNSILTPHIGEFDRMVGSTGSSLERLNKQKQFSQEHRCIVVLKGPYTSISDIEGNIYFNNSGNEALAVGGSGDILTGIIVSLLAQGYNSLDAACIGVFVHGHAADIYSGQHSSNALTPRILVDYIREAFDDLYKFRIR